MHHPIKFSDFFADAFLDLSNLQGMTSQGDVELSVISKNFFFTFFIFFVAFTLVGTAATAFGLDEIRKKLQERLGNVLGTAKILATALETLGPLYMNLIVLQAFGIFPLRLLEFGSVFLYPIGLMGAKTPRGESASILRSSSSLTLSQTMLNSSNLQFSATASSSLKQFSYLTSALSTAFFHNLSC